MEPPLPRLLGPLGPRVRDLVGPELERQQDFNSVLVQALNVHLDETARLHSRLRELAAALVHYAQQVLPVVDARDRWSSALSTERSELVIEGVQRRQESLSLKVDRLQALRDRIEALGSELGALREALAPGASLQASASSSASGSLPGATRGLTDEALRRWSDDALYMGFENRFRGERGEIRERLASYVTAFRSLAPVVDLGCGRGEFLELLKDAGIESRGVESNQKAVQECRQRGLDVSSGDLLSFLRSVPESSLGGVFAAQVAEHLPAEVLIETIREARRALRLGGLLVLETPNPRSVTGFLEVWTRDLTHRHALHPETLRFLAGAAGFGETWVEFRSEVPASAQLQPVPSEGLPPAAAEALRENLARLNALLFGPQEYALFARR